MRARSDTAQSTLEPHDRPPAPLPGGRRASPLPSPADLRRELPRPPGAAASAARARAEIRDLLHGRDPERLLVVLGPCSIHDAGSALEYARRLRTLQQSVRAELLLVMRCYFEKPRSALGWRGLLTDPGLDGGDSAVRGLRLCRRLLGEIGALGVPCAGELLDPLAAPYLEDGLAWAAIGARTSASQPHRALASGLELPVGLKNGIDGDLDAAVGALETVREPATYFGLDDGGGPALIHSAGNPDAHLVLRGGREGPNCDAESVRRATAGVGRVGGPVRPVLVDCSHGNSGKQPQRQALVLREVLAQFAQGQRGILGLMLESHLEPGRQDLHGGAPPRSGTSITDACIGWGETEDLLGSAAGVVKSSR